MAGLIVIDFIDMDFHRNQTAVERRLKEGMEATGPVSDRTDQSFGLLELSNNGYVPVSLKQQPMYVRTRIWHTTLHESTALRSERNRGRVCQKTRTMMTVAMQSPAAFVLNHKRGALAEIEKKFDVKIDISVDDSLIPPNFAIQRIKTDNDDREISDGGASDGDRENCDDEPKRRKRRRPRRRKRSDQETVAEGLDRPITSNEDNTTRPVC